MRCDDGDFAQAFAACCAGGFGFIDFRAVEYEQFADVLYFGAF